MVKPLALIALVLIVLRSGLAQEQQPVIRPTSTPQTAETFKPLILKLNYNPQQSTAYINVYGPSEKAKWIWVTRFLKYQGWQPQPGYIPVRAVRVEAQFNGETVDVGLSLFRGHERFEKEEFLGKSQIGIGECRTLTDLREVGVEPFDVCILDSVPPPPATPILDVRTAAVEVTSVETVNVPLPAYRIKFKNLTNRNIAALRVNVENSISTFFQGKEGLPLIAPNEVHEELLVFSHPLADTQYKVIVSTAVFDDGSFSGEPQPACDLALSTAGRIYWMKELIPVLEKAIAEPPSDAAVAAARFKERVLAMQLDPPQSPPVFGFCKVRWDAPKSSAMALRLYFLQEVEPMITTRPKPPIDFKAWLASKRDSYVNWLDRLQAPSRPQR